MKRSLYLAPVLAGLFWFFWSSSVLAQGPIEPCFADQPNTIYQSWGLNQDVHSSTGWQTIDGSFSLSGDPTAYFGNGFTGGNATFYKDFALPLDLPDEFEAVKVTITAGASAARVGNIVVRIANGPQGLVGQFGDAIDTRSITIAHGLVRDGIRRVELFGSSNGTLTIYNLEIEPIGTLTKTNNTFIDPENNGIDWPAWTKVEAVTDTIYIDAGSRDVGGWLEVDDTGQIFCTPVSLRASGATTATIYFNGDRTGNRSGNISGAILFDVTEAISATYGGTVSIAGTAAHTMSLAVENSGNFLCLQSSAWGGSVGDLRLDDFSASNICDGCEILPDPDFLIDYDSIYATPPLSEPPAYDSWLYPVAPPDFDIAYYHPNVISGALYLDSPNFAVGAYINEAEAKAIYTVTLSARLVGGSSGESQPLSVGFARGITEAARANHYALNQIEAGDLIWDTTPISGSTYQNYTTTLTNTISTAPFFIMMANEAEVNLSKYIEIDYVCLTGAGRFSECVTVPDSTFTNQFWELGGNAGYTSEGLEIYQGGIAQQRNLDPPIPAIPHYAYVGVFEGDGLLQVTLEPQNITATLQITGQGSYTASLGIIDPFTTIRLETLTGTLTLNYICIGPRGVSNNNCLDIVLNPNFDDQYSWHFGNGSTWNSSALNAWLPFIPSGTWDNFGLGVVGQILLGQLPELDPGQKLALEFEARTPADSGFISAAMRNGPAVIQSFEVDEFYQTYTADMSAMSGTSNTELFFVNSSYQYTETSDIFVDSVCLYVTDQISDTVKPSEGRTDFLLSCGNISYWLSDTLKIDFPGLELLVDDGISVWDVENWVPWLAGTLWVNAAKPVICVMLALARSGPGLTVLNVLEWAARQFELVTLFFVAVLTQNFWAWLVFAGQVTLRLFSWLSGWPGWLMRLGIDLVEWGFYALASWAMTTLNFLISAWNILLPSVSQTLSELAELPVTIWNNYLAPFLGDFASIGSFFSFIIGIFGIASDILGALFGLVSELFGWVWGIFIDLIQAPLTFFHAFNEAINGPGFEFVPVCEGTVVSPQCLLVAGIILFSQAMDAYFGYPIAISIVVIGSVFFFWRELWPLVQKVFR